MRASMAAKPGGLEVVGAADRRVVVLAHQLVSRPFGERLDRFPLPLVAVLVGADVGRRADVLGRKRIACTCSLVGHELGPSNVWNLEINIQNTGRGSTEAVRQISIHVTAVTSLGPCPRIVCRYRIWEMTMRLIRFAIGMSVVAVSVIGSAVAHSPVELTQVIGKEALANRFDSGFGNGFPAQ